MLGTAAIVAGGSLLGGAMESRSQEEINEQNIAFARRNTLYQTHMSNTAYQRAVEDMKKAGINPMMAATKGGASTPAGMTPKLENPKAAVAKGFANAARAVAMEVPMNEANIENTKAGSELKKEETHVKEAQAYNMEKERKLMDEKTKSERLAQAEIQARTREINATTAQKVADLPRKKLVGDAVTIARGGVEVIGRKAGKLASTPVDSPVGGGKRVYYPNGVFSPGVTYGAGNSNAYGGKNSAKPSSSGTYKSH